MEKKEYLNEEWYKSVKKKIIRISLVIFIISILIGGGLIVTGIIKTDSSKTNATKLNEERKVLALKESQEKIDTAKKRIEEIESEKATLTTQYDSKKQECDSIPTNSSDWFSKTSQCNRDASAIQTKIMDLETEKFKLDNGNYTVYYDKATAKSYIFLYMIGGFIILAGGMISLMFYVLAKKREIQSFVIQQSMPVAQEAIEKIAPTIGVAAGTIAKGLKEGLKEEEK